MRNGKANHALGIVVYVYTVRATIEFNFLNILRKIVQALLDDARGRSINVVHMFAWADKALPTVRKYLEDTLK